jgi:hypothetical protein
MLCPAVLLGQTFTGTGAAIPDNGDVLEIPLVVNGLGATIDTMDMGLEQVCFTIEHSWISDLEVSIVAPDGTVGVLVTSQGGDTDDYANTCFRTDATTSILAAGPPYAGTFRPQGQMGAVNNGQNGNGTWYLRVFDTYAFADDGDVIGWSITFGSDPADYFAYTAGDLPLIIIDTDGQPIPDGEKLDCSMGVVDNGPVVQNRPTDPFNGYDGRIGIELRGNSSLGLSPKKSYSVELRDENGDDIDASLLGMPAEADWILSANHFDKSFMNNPLTFHLARSMGRYAPRTRHVEVMINGEYQGIYVLMERIKRGPGRLDIARLRPEDVAGDDLTGGYILSVDRDEGPEQGFVSFFPALVNDDGQEIYFKYRYPQAEDMVPAQSSYIQDYMLAFETALDGPQFTEPMSGYRSFADAPSFVDMLLINELSRNVDGYRLSSYLFKEKDSDGGKLNVGPAWDYDIAWGNADYCNGALTTGWAYDFGEVCGGDGNQVPFWWSRMLEDPRFVEDVRCRWNELRTTVLSPSNIDRFCDSLALVLENAQARNFTVWPILGTYVWPNPSPIPSTYAGEVQELKTWAASRWAWLDANLPGVCTIGIDGPSDGTGEMVFPNPFVDHVWISTEHPLERIRLIDPQGRTIMDEQPMSHGPALRVALPADSPVGVYMLLIRSADGTERAHRLMH